MLSFLNRKRLLITPRQPQPVLTLIPRLDDSPPVHWRFANSAPIEFWVNGRKGVRLLDAQADNTFGLADADMEAMTTPGVKVTYKIEVIAR